MARSDHPSPFVELTLPTVPGGIHPDAGTVAIQNLLASRPIEEVTSDRVLQLLTEHQVLPERRARVLVALFKRALREFLRDEVLTPAEVAYLQRLQAIFGLAPSTAAEAYADLARAAYRSLLNYLFLDEEISSDERVRLQRLTEQLALPPVEQFRIAGDLGAMRELVERATSAPNIPEADLDLMEFGGRLLAPPATED